MNALRDRAALAVVAECCRLCQSESADLHEPILRAALEAFVVDRAALYRVAGDSGEFELVQSVGFPVQAPARVSLGLPAPEFVACPGDGGAAQAGETLRRALGVDRALWRHEPQAELALVLGAGRQAPAPVLDFSESDREVLGTVLSAVAGLSQAKALEAGLREAQERYTLLAENVHDVILVLDMDLNYVYLSPSIHRLTGWTVEELRGRPVPETLSAESIERAQQTLVEELERECSGDADPCRSRTLALELLTRDGPPVTIEVTLRFIRDEEGRATGIAGVARDITERRRTEEALRQSEERLTLALEAANEGLWDWSVPTGELYVSPRWLGMLGYEPDEMPHRYETWSDLLHPGDRERAESCVADCVRRGTGFDELQFRMRTKSGDYRWVLSRGQVVERDERGRPVRMVGTHVDITDLKTTEASLLTSKATAWAMLNATHDLALLLDTDHRAVGVNQAMARRLGRSPEELLGMHLLDILPPDIGKARQARMDEAMQTGQPVHFEDSRNGRYFANAIYPVHGDDDEVHQVAVFSQDITERRQAEQTQRLAALGQLAAGVAHEFNNILAGIMLTIERTEVLDTAQACDGLADRVRSLARRGAKIAGNLTTFANPAERGRRAVDVDDVIDSALAVTSSEVLQAGVIVEHQRGGEGARVMGNPSELGQVFVNLIINACQAMPEGGALTITTRRVRGSEGGAEVVVAVTDSGVGIAREHLPHVFDPFFSTKGILGGSETPGAGLGLSVSHGIITGHGGSIEVQSEPGMGTTFLVRLPALGEPADDRKPAEPAGTGLPAAQRGTRVLLAEDEPEIGQMIAEVLERQGHQVTHVTTGNEAVEQLAEQEFALVITDLLMPGAGGEDVLREARGQAQQPRLMVITGHIGDDVAQELRDRGVDVVLKKPFGVMELLRSVEDALHRE